MKKLVLYFSMLLVSISAMSVKADYTDYQVISEITFYEGIPGLLITQPEMLNKGSCKSNRYILPNTHPLYREMVSMVVTAHMSQQPVNLFVKDEECLSQYAKIRHIISQK